MSLLVKTLDRYLEEIAEGLDCRVRAFTPPEPQETVVLLLSWIPRPPHEALEPAFSNLIADMRETVLHLATSREIREFSLVEHHALPGAERIGLILFGETPDSPNFWQVVERQALEELLGESLEAPVGNTLTRIPDTSQLDNQYLAAS